MHFEWVMQELLPGVRYPRASEVKGEASYKNMDKGTVRNVQRVNRTGMK